MSQPDSFLHTTTRTVSWLRATAERGELNLKPPFQRNPVWTDSQKSYLIGTILKGYPIPELYMQDTVNEEGKERHDVVDGQQRIRSCLDFLSGDFTLEEADDWPQYAGLKFDELPSEARKTIHSYKFVVRILPEMDAARLREVFRRLNKNVEALNRQELRHATYWGPFIKSMEEMSDKDLYWSQCGIFTANEVRRMLDQEFISELAIAFLHGAQNKKDKLDYYYQLYEKSFESRTELEAAFAKVTGELSQCLPELSKTRWRKKSDFYTLFIVLLKETDHLPFSSDVRKRIRDRLLSLGGEVDRVLALEKVDFSKLEPAVARYVRGVARAASDRLQRVRRHDALVSLLFDRDLPPESPDADEEEPEGEE